MTGVWGTVIVPCIEDGARVAVSGRARSARTDAPAPPEGGYRGAAPAIIATRRVEGTPTDRVVVSDGGRSTLVYRSAAPVLMLVIGAMGLAAYAVGAAVLLTW